MFVWATWVYSANPGILISCDSFKRNLINQTAKPRPEKDIITIRKVSQAAVCTLSQTGKPHWRKIKLQAALRGTCCRHRLTFCSLHGKCHEEEKEERRTSDRRSTKCKCDCAKMCFYLHWKCFICYSVKDWQSWKNLKREAKCVDGKNISAGRRGHKSKNAIKE